MLETAKDITQLLISIATLGGIGIGIWAQFRTMRNVRLIEIATNSMKDALVAATEKSAGLEGEKRGREAEQKRDKMES